MEATPLKTVALHDTHQQLGAKIVPFAGYAMPVRYSSDLEEHHAVRRGVGIFDVSHMGEFRVRGPQALALIQRTTSNDASKLAPGKAQYSCLPNNEGGIVDDLLVYMLGVEDYFLVVNASNIDKDWQWLQAHNTEGAELENVSDQLSLFAVQGPKAAALQSLTEVDLSAIPYYSFAQGTFAGAAGVIISATGYTGAGGFELYVPNEHAAHVWEQVMAAGQPYGIRPIGLGARDTLRLEMGYCLYGNDITDTTSPLEAGLGWITKFTKEFTNSANLKKQKEAGVTRKLVGFVMDGPGGLPRAHYPLVDAAGQPIGEVTSGGQSPTLSRGIGLGYVQAELAAPGTPIFVQVRGKNLPATVQKLPLVPGTEEA